METVTRRVQSPPDTPMTNSKNLINDMLSLEQTGSFEFKGQSYNPGWNRVYGGQVIAQAIMAATRTVNDEDICHSTHGYFMRPGDPDIPITFKIDPVRDGRSFQTRMVYAQQEKETIFAMGASFHKEEPGLEHQDEMGDIPGPETLPPIKQLIARYRDKLHPQVANYFEKDRPFEIRPLDITRYMNNQPRPAMQSIWLKPTTPISGAFACHQAALGYASDFTLLDTALIAHGKLLFDPGLMLASLDHSIWFHRPFDINDWLLYRQTSSNAYGARALCHGQFFTQKGELVASTAQEGLTRPKN